jgi:Flp pilus assembly protein TadB
MLQERERLEAAHRNERQRVEDMYGMQVKDDSRRLAEAQREWTDREEELRRRHAAELARVREQAVIEREQWQRAMQEKLEQGVCVCACVRACVRACIYRIVGLGARKLGVFRLLCVCVCVCVCACVCTYTYIHTYIHTHTYICTYI